MLVNHGVLAFTNYDSKSNGFFACAVFVGAYEPVIFFKKALGYEVAHQVDRLDSFKGVSTRC